MCHLPRFRIGRDLLMIVTVSTVLCAVLLWLVAVRGIGTVGEFAVEANKLAICNLAGQYLSRSVSERADRYNAVFDSAGGYTRTAAKMIAQYLAHQDVYGSYGVGTRERYTFDAAKGVYHNQPVGRVACASWGGPKMTKALRREINALSHVDPILVQARETLPGAASSWAMLDSAIIRYTPHIDLISWMPPAREQDFREDICFRLGVPSNNPKRRTVWSDVYRDTLGQGLVVTVATPVYSASNHFLGVTGMEFSLSGLVAEIMQGASEWEEFSVLIDGNGQVLAMPMSKLNLLGLAFEGEERFAPGQSLGVKLSESQEADIRAVAEDMIAGRAAVRAVNLGGMQYLMAFHPLASTGWSFATIVSRSDLLASITDTRITMEETVATARMSHTMLAGAVGGITLLILLLFTGGRVVHPVRRLLLATQNVAEGRFNERLTGFGRDEFGELAGAFNTMMDELDRGRRKLAEAEGCYRSIFENAVEGIFQTSPDGKVLSANPALAGILGYDSPEQLQREVTDIGQQVYTDPRQRQVFLDKMSEGDEQFSFETKLRKRDGSKIWARWQGRGLWNEHGELLSFIGLMEDVTESRKAQERIHALNRELLLAQENERKLIALHLHDNVAQNLSFLKIQATHLADLVPDGEADEVEEDFQRVMSETISAVRNMAYELRPSGLDELGLERTLELYCTEVEQRFGIEVLFSAAGMDAVTIAPEVQINIFRIIQESLRNVGRHAKAARATVKVVVSHPNIIVRIRDDGVGFDPDEQQENAVRSRRMGVQGMRERARMMGGEMTIASRPGMGTSIFFEVPLSRVWDDAADQRSRLS